VANKKRPRPWIPTRKWSIDYLENLLTSGTDEVNWDRKVLDQILYYHPSEYLKFQTRWEQSKRRK
jgi:hypothetical protein